jgi:3-oxoacyl-[acyl-carrier protein] reductase
MSETAPEGDCRLQLGGRRALVSGGTRNIGRAIAEGFAAAGADVAVIGGRDRPALDATLEAVSAHGVRAAGAIQSLDDPDGLHRVLDRLTNEIGAIDILVNVAAVRPRVELADISVHEWDRVLAVNVRAPFLLAQAVFPGMCERGFGRIVNFSGMNAYWGRHSRAHVVTSKGAIVALSRALATEGAAHGVTVNTLVPGTIDTDRHAPEWYPDPVRRPKRQLDRVPMGRLGKPDDVVSAVLFLASPRSAYITGQELFVTGGSFPLVHE